MKTFKSFFALAAFAALAIGFTSCQKEAQKASEPLTPKAEFFSKEVTVTDPSGQNSATFKISAQDESLLGNTDWSKVIEIAPIFEIPEQNGEEAAKQTTKEPTDADNLGIHLELLSQNHQNGAIGLSMKVNDEASEGGVDDRWQWVYTLTTTYDHIQVNANYYCHGVDYFRRQYSSSGFGWFFSAYVCPYGYSWAYWVPSYQMRAKIYFNNGASFTWYVW